MNARECAEREVHRAGGAVTADLREKNGAEARRAALCRRYEGGLRMRNDYVYEVGDIVTLKKPHPCGSKEWEILRVGADFRLKCAGCGHQIMIARKLVEKNTKDLKKKS